MNTILKTAAAIAALIVAPTLPASAQPVLPVRPGSDRPRAHGAGGRGDRAHRGPRPLPPPDREYHGNEPAGTIIVDTPNTYLYYVLGNGRAIRYGIGVGREGFTWSGVQKITRSAEWPDWHPPAEMIARQPYLPRFMAGGQGNPLGARALYLGNSVYRIHGTNKPTPSARACRRAASDDQRRRGRPLQPREPRHPRCGAAADRPSRRGPLDIRDNLTATRE